MNVIGGVLHKDGQDRAGSRGMALMMRAPRPRPSHSIRPRGDCDKASM